MNKGAKTSGVVQKKHNTAEKRIDTNKRNLRGSPVGHVTAVSLVMEKERGK
jgi:hypothetical protein